MSSSSSQGPGPRQISLQRDAQTRYISGAVDGFRFIVRAHGEVGMPLEIFRYLRVLNLPVIGQSSDVFSGVCSTSDLQELAIDNPLTQNEYPFFRKSDVDLIFPSQEVAERAWVFLQEDVNKLVRTLNLMDQLEQTDDVTLTGA